MCRVPILMWLAPPFGFTVGTVVLWRIEAFQNGNGALASILSTLIAILFWVSFILATRCFWQQAATYKQHSSKNWSSPVGQKTMKSSIRLVG